VKLCAFLGMNISKVGIATEILMKTVSSAI
jgi:hypothetical protein